MNTENIKGSTRPHEAAKDEGISLANFGIPAASMDAWMHLQGYFAKGEVTPCAGRSEWTSGNAADKATAVRLCNGCPAKAACLEFATINKERGAIYGGKEF